MAASTRVVSQKFIEEQSQVLRLILAQNAPKFAQDDSFICSANFRLITLRHFSDVCWVTKWRAMWIFLEEKSTRQWWLRSMPIREML